MQARVCLWTGSGPAASWILFSAFVSLSRAQNLDLTNYDSISLDLRRHWASSLPPLPRAAMDASRWSGVNSSVPFQVIRAHLSDEPRFCPNQTVVSTAWPNGTLSAGPRFNCSFSACTNGITEDGCKALGGFNSLNGIVSLTSRHGTFWSPQSAQPAWAQFRFPTPTSSSQVTFRFTMDTRYPPGMRGGNPCERARTNASHECDLCTTELRGGAWDHAVPAGVYLLWAYPNASRHVISGPIDVRALYDSGERTIVADSPLSLNLTGQGEVSVTLLAFNQYPYTGELRDGVNGYDASNPTRCSVVWTRNASEPSGVNILLNVVSAEVVTRSDWNPPTVPPAARPRLFGLNPTWQQRFVAPFETAPCVATAAVHPGWGGASGMPDFKTAWTMTAMGYAPCHTSGSARTPPASIRDKVSTTYASASFRSFTGANQWNGALSALHLVRRMRACHEQAGASCQFNASETQWLAETIARSELSWFDPAARVRSSSSWGWEQDSDGCCGFDLQTAVPLKFFSFFLDIVGSDAVAINNTIVDSIKSKMRWYIDDFVGKFNSGDWSLWNGNNWTPVLTEGATYWAIAMWHEEGSLPAKVMHIVNDINVLHRAMITQDGVYKEGLCQYSYMSVRSTLAIAVAYAQSFGESWPTLNATAISSLGAWQMDSHDSGYGVNFGDSHSCRGTVPETLFALFAPALGQPNFNAAAAAMPMDGCLIRMWATMAYFVQVRDPWNFWPVVVARNWSVEMAQCSGANLRGATPLGPLRSVVYPAGGYGVIRSPLLSACTSADVSRWQCSNSTRPPELLDVGMYSQLSMQARPNEFPHSEVDFGSFKWTAFGSSLVTEFGYGTIATAVNQFDSRRLVNPDNNPSGHNTIVIREALLSANSAVDFSQFQWEKGTIEAETSLGLSCQHLDGSRVYGSTRPNGWLRYMHRWFCEVQHGNYFLVEALAVKPNRSRLSVYGAAYGGPNFLENVSSSYDELTVDDYFYTPHWLSGTVITNVTNTSFDRATAGRWCSHTSLEQPPNTNRSILIRTDCAFMDTSITSNITGRVSAWSERGGRIEVDGLVSVPDRWGTLNLHKNRFRYESHARTTSSGDIRAFLMTAEQGVPAETWIESYGPPVPGRIRIAACVNERLVTVLLQRGQSSVTMNSAQQTNHPCNGAVAGSGLQALTPATTSPTSTSQAPSLAPVSLQPTARPTLTPVVAGVAPTATPTATGQSNQAANSDDNSTTVAVSVAVVAGVLALVTFLVVFARRARQPTNKAPTTVLNPRIERNNIYVPSPTTNGTSETGL